VRQRLSHNDVYFKEMLLDKFPEIISVKTKHIFQNKWKRNTTLPSREIPHTGINAGSPTVSATMLQMYLITLM